MTKVINGYEIKPFADLYGANLRDAYLYGANLCGANLHGADLCGANLRDADLHDANLCGANLCGANLCGANLHGADLRDAYLYGANLCGANLHGANLRDADLCGADLYGANLRGADLYGANLYGANLRGANLWGAKNIPKAVMAALQVLPDEGDIVGWKKCKEGVIVKLLVKSDTPRSSATTRKCRAKEVTVLEVFGAMCGVSKHDGKTIYEKGCAVECDTWGEDRWNECVGGIHFFITRQEAEDY